MPLSIGLGRWRPLNSDEPDDGHHEPQPRHPRMFSGIHAVVLPHDRSTPCHISA